MTVDTITLIITPADWRKTRQSIRGISVIPQPMQHSARIAALDSFSPSVWSLMILSLAALFIDRVIAVRKLN